MDVSCVWEGDDADRGGSDVAERGDAGGQGSGGVMSSTDVPNGVLFVGQKGHVALVDLDEAGVMAEQVEELSRDGGDADVARRQNSLRFVHTVKGEESMLIRDLFSVLLMEKVEGMNKPVPVLDALKRGKLEAIVKDAYDGWVRRLNEGEKEEVSEVWEDCGDEQCGA